MLEYDELKFALDDARCRQAALVALMYSIDRQAESLLRLYLTLGLASASAGTAILLGKIPIPPPIGVGLLASVVTLLLGSWHCLRAMRPASITLPGRGAEFWIWAQHDDVKFSDAAAQYLKELKDSQNCDRKLNQTCATSLRWAKLMAPLTLILALALLALSYLVSGSGLWFISG